MSFAIATLCRCLYLSNDQACCAVPIPRLWSCWYCPYSKEREKVDETLHRVYYDRKAPLCGQSHILVGLHPRDRAVSTLASEVRVEYRQGRHGLHLCITKDRNFVLCSSRHSSNPWFASQETPCVVAWTSVASSRISVNRQAWSFGVLNAHSRAGWDNDHDQPSRDGTM